MSSVKFTLILGTYPSWNEIQNNFNVDSNTNNLNNEKTGDQHDTANVNDK